MPSYPVYDSTMISNFLDPWEADSVYLLYSICWACVVVVVVLILVTVVLIPVILAAQDMDRGHSIKVTNTVFPTSSP